MAGYERSDRFNGEIQKALTEILQREVKDPRVPDMVSVTRVETSRDLTSAKVYVSAMIEEEGAKNMLKFFKDAGGFFRSELGKRVTMRVVPELTFYWDRNIEYSAHIAEVLRTIKSEDEK